MYITKNGNFFLAGEGGAFSKYSESYGNSTGGGSDIIPLTKAEAFEWLEEKEETEVIEEYFSDMITEA